MREIDLKIYAAFQKNCPVVNWRKKMKPEGPV